MRTGLLLLSTLLFAGVAHADTVSTFNFVNTTLTDGATITGSVDINVTTGAFADANFVLVDGGNTYDFTGAGSGTSSYAGAATYTAYNVPIDTSFVLELPGSSLVGYSGGSICSLTSLCSGPSSSALVAPTDSVLVNTGSLALAPAVAPTPEPSSLMLLGTGALGVAGVLRRRFV